jgi:hypothetical protein
MFEWLKDFFGGGDNLDPPNPPDANAQVAESLTATTADFDPSREVDPAQAHLAALVQSETPIEATLIETEHPGIIYQAGYSEFILS